MFHLRDGLWVQEQKEGYIEQLDEFRHVYATFFVTENIAFAEIRDGSVQHKTGQKIVFSTELNTHALASMFATLSMRGETAETFKEALEFLQRFEQAPNEQK